MSVSECLFSDKSEWICMKVGIVDLYMTLRKFQSSTLTVLCERNVTLKCTWNNLHVVWINKQILLRV
jgi:hypothetical protein